MASSTCDLQLYYLSHPREQGAPLCPYFPDIKIKRFHYHAKSGVLSQQITTIMRTSRPNAGGPRLHFAPSQSRHIAINHTPYQSRGSASLVVQVIVTSIV